MNTKNVNIFFSILLWVQLFSMIFINCGDIGNSNIYVLKEGDIETARQFVRTALSEQKGYNLLKELTDIGHRLSGSETSLQAIDWAFNKMTELGFENVTKQSLMAPNWVRGDIESAEIVSAGMYRGRALNIAALGRSVGTPAGGITAGVIEVESIKEASELGDRAKGKIIFYNRPLDMGLLSTFSGYGGAAAC